MIEFSYVRNALACIDAFPGHFEAQAEDRILVYSQVTAVIKASRESSCGVPSKQELHGEAFGRNSEKTATSLQEASRAPEESILMT